MIFGILAGLAGSTSQATSYIFSRRYVNLHGQGVTMLMAIGHLWMALFSLCLLPFVLVTPHCGYASLAWPLFATAFFYLAGQTAMFWTIKTIPASVLSPLLSMKLIFLFIFTYLFTNTIIVRQQAFAVALVIVAALIMKQSGKKLSLVDLGKICLTCFLYSLSDWHIRELISAYDIEGGLMATLSALASCYLLCGLFAVPFIKQLKSSKRCHWTEALPYAVLWYSGMLGLFLAIDILGVVLAVIVQSMRGLISIGIGVIVAKLGHQHIEEAKSKKVLLQQVAAALLTIAAITLYSLSSQEQKKPDTRPACEKGITSKR